MGFFGGHDRACQCKSCSATMPGGRGAKPAKLSGKEQRRNDRFSAKHNQRNQPTKRSTFFGL